MIATEPTPARDPGKASLDDPPSGKRAEPRWKELIPVDLLSIGHQHPAFGHGEGAHRLHGPTQIDLQPRDHLASVMAIAPQRLHPGKLLFEWQEHLFGSLLVVPIGCMRFDLQ